MSEEVNINYKNKNTENSELIKIFMKIKKAKNLLLLLIIFTTLILIIFQNSKKKTLNTSIIYLKTENEKLSNLIKTKTQIFTPKILPYKGEYDSKSIVDNILFPYKSNIIKSLDELLFLRNIFGKVSMRMLYQATKHGDDFETFQKRTNTHHHHLILIKTKSGKRFGGYTSDNFSLHNVAGYFVDCGKFDKTAFLFNLDQQKIYNVDQKNTAIFVDEEVIVQFGGLDIRIEDKFFGKKGTSEFPYFYGKGNPKLELTSGEKEFEIEEIEDFHINFFPRDFMDDYNKKGRYSLNYNEYDY
jgi:hypothetical protein